MDCTRQVRNGSLHIQKHDKAERVATSRQLYLIRRGSTDQAESGTLPTTNRTGQRDQQLCRRLAVLAVLDCIVFATEKERREKKHHPRSVRYSVCITIQPWSCFVGRRDHAQHSHAHRPMHNNKAHPPPVMKKNLQLNVGPHLLPLSCVSLPRRLELVDGGCTAPHRAALCRSTSEALAWQSLVVSFSPAN